MPPGIPYIVGNEAAERFSFYGMKAILTVFMMKYLMGSDGQLATMGEADARFWVHTFVVAAYFFPLIGAILSDWIFGKYKTILFLSVVYCLGHLALETLDVPKSADGLQSLEWFKEGRMDLIEEYCRKDTQVRRTDLAVRQRRP